METSSNYKPTTELLRLYMPIVHRVVAQLARRLPRSVPREDLVAAGMFGLYEALQKGAPESPAMFAAYATIRVRGAMMDELRRLDWFPRRRKPTTAEAPTHEAGAPAASAAGELRPSSPARALVRFDDLEGFDPATNDGRTPMDQIEEKVAYRALYGAVSALPERERLIVSMRYFDGLSGKDVASALGLSEARVSQLHARALDRLRRSVEGQEQVPIAA
jgi:RNA polymerase sigma factor for flagellar operon FliA